MDNTYGQLNDYPLRILVPSDSVGAIIGKQGSNVKQIKQNTHAKIDVNKNEPSNPQERVISFRGQQENCIQACREVLRIIYEDAKNKNRSNDIILKVLAHNNFIGRIIGKGGNIINSIKIETDTKITVSSMNELNSFNLDRIISIKGELDQQMRALKTIYTKLCSAHENDSTRAWNHSTSVYHHQPHPQQQNQFAPHFNQTSVMMSSTANGSPQFFSTHYTQQHQHPSVIQSTSSNSSNSSTSKYMEQASHYQNPTPIYHQSYYPSIVPFPNSYYMPYPSANHMMSSYPHLYGNLGTNANGNFTQQHQQPNSQSTVPLLESSSEIIETVRLYVPNSVIGAIIGTKGLFIKSIINNSNASVKISPLSAHEDQNKIIDRQITISGTPEAQWKSQYYIYDKIRQEGYAGEDEVRLRAEIDVPISLIGRLVGKGGQNVRHLQQSTGAIIKLPEDSQHTTASEVPVKIIGSFQASQFAQRRIQSIIQTSRDSTNSSNEDSNSNKYNNNNNEQSNNIIMNSTLSTNLNEGSIIVNGNTNSDVAVTVSSTMRNSDDDCSIKAIDETKPSDE